MSVFNFFELKSQPLWDEYVLKHPNGSVFHLSTMFRAFEAATGYSPFNIAACNRDGEIVAMLAAVKVSQTSDDSSTKTASHSVMYAEPLCNDTDEGASALVQLLNMYDRVWSKESLFSEIRPMECSDQQSVIFQEQNYQRLNSRNLVIDLSQSPDTISGRADIDKVDPTADFTRVSNFIRKCCRNSESANAQISYLESLVNNLPPEIVRLRFASVDGVDVAISLGLVFKDRYVSWYKTTSEEAKAEVVSALVGDEIKEAIALDLNSYDFGNSDWRTNCSHLEIIESSFEHLKIPRSYYKKIGLKLSMALRQKKNFIQGNVPNLSLCETPPPKGAHHD